jgi:murein DD-endopeptidase MepM/ murein hydrolase activator NlpD
MLLSPVRAPLRITQGFGGNEEIYKRFGLKGHNGVDFTGPIKGVRVPLYSPYDVQVAKIGDEGNDGYGKYVRLFTKPDHTGRVRDVVLAHLHSISVKPGQIIPLGDPIGVMGSTGFSSGIHVHTGLRYRNEKLEILNYDNGYFGYVDFEPYLLYALTDPSNVVSHPYA